MSGEATNEIYIFFTSLVKLKTYLTKRFEFSFYYTPMTSLDLDDRQSSRTEDGCKDEKRKISANPNNFGIKIFLMF